MSQIVIQGKKYVVTEYENSNIYVVENVIEKELCNKIISSNKKLKYFSRNKKTTF